MPGPPTYLSVSRATARIGVQRLEGVGHVAGLHERGQRVLVLQVVHDARELDLVAQRGAMPHAGERVDDLAGAAQVVHVRRPRLCVDGQRVLAGARGHRVARRAGRQGRLDERRGHQQPVLRPRRAARRAQRRARPLRVDAHAGPLEQAQRGLMDRLEVLLRPELGDARPCTASATARSRQISDRPRRRRSHTTTPAPTTATATTRIHSHTDEPPPSSSAAAVAGLRSM